MTAEFLLQQTINGLQLGLNYALIALGYTMVYGVIRLINFAHADIFMIGAYLGLFLAVYGGRPAAGLPAAVWWLLAAAAGYLLQAAGRRRCGPWNRLCRRLERRQREGAWPRRAAAGGARAGLWLAGFAAAGALCFPLLRCPALFLPRLSPAGRFAFLILFAMLACGLLGAALERIAYRPLRGQPRLAALITALGVSLFLENFCSLPWLFGANPRVFPRLISHKPALLLAERVPVSWILLVNAGVVAALLAGLWFLVERTLLGKQMRAVAFNPRAAALMGIDVNRVIAGTFFIGAALAGASGALFAANYGVLQSPFLGFAPGLKAFIAAVLGGIGSLPGAVVGGLLLGVIEVFANAWNSNLGYAIALVLLIAVLLVRPAGLLGRAQREKV